MLHELPKLPYSFDALEPHMDAQTVEIHYSKHHQAYATKMNEVLAKYPDLADENPEDLLKRVDSLDMDQTDKQKFINFAGGYVNHNLFWSIMGPEKEVDEALAGEIEQTFGSLDEFKEKFNNLAATLFGSGWTWLVKNQQGSLEVYNLLNQDSPLSKGHTPILTLDVWEHAYYLKYQNRRPAFIEAWWNIVKLLP
ncbi:superoxide dismutase [Patescibacteria group bacterium]